MLGFIKDKITRKVETWDGKFISKPGKEVLIKSVAQTIPSYAMGVFLLPLEITKDIERTIAKYWWSSKSDGTRGIHWMCWDRLCKHKSTGGLGFRNFRDFNLALLAKQGWRFLTKPNSLVSRLYKARYFPSSDFLNSSLGSNPSFIWRSVWETREVLRSGLRWTIGNGNNIDIVGQPWLNDAVNPYPTSSSESFQNANISSLFAMNSTDWDMDIIRDLFNVRDQNCIRHTMVEGGLDEDKLYWSKEASGMYTVKSAYRLLQTQKGLWNAADNESLWKQMWRIKAPPKTLNLLWRAMSGCLPTNVQLQHRHVPILSSCPVCEHEEETTLHILVFCPFAQLCWQLFKPQLLSIQCEDFAGWMAQAMETCNAKTRAELATLCWAIWKARNDKVWRNKKARANYVCSSAMQYLLQWKNAQSKDYKPISHYSREGDGASLWVKPQGDTIKISVDAACFGQSSAYGSGMVVRDSTGELIYASSKLFHGSASSELAEVIAIREALSWLKNGQWNGVVVESDCLVAIQAIRSRIAMVSPFDRVVATCRKLLEDLVTTSLSFIKRSANEAAHYMARESYSFPDRVLDRSNVPIELLNILQVDSSN